MASDGDGAAQEREPDPDHIGRAGQEQAFEERRRQGRQQAERRRAEQRVNRSAEHDSGHRRQSDPAAARQGVGQYEQHVHARHDDDTEQQGRKDPEVFRVGHKGSLLAGDGGQRCILDFRAPDRLSRTFLVTALCQLS
jgi:hypothetical protein